MEGKDRPDGKFLQETGRIECESFSGNLSSEVQDSYSTNLDLSGVDSFENHFGFLAPNSFQDTLMKSGNSFSSGFCQASGETVSGSCGYFGRGVFKKQFKNPGSKSLFGSFDAFMKKTFSNNSRFVFGFPMIFVGAEAFQFHRLLGLLTVAVGIALLGIGQCYREYPEGLDG